jgi:hypothetical protein
MTYATITISPRGPLTPIPTLWEMAKRLFERLTGYTGSAAEVARRVRISRDDRKLVLSWLEPVESLVRLLLFSQALTYLIMAPEARALLKENASPPSPPPPSQPPSQPAPPPAPSKKPPRDLRDPNSWSCSFRVLEQTHIPFFAQPTRPQQADATSRRPSAPPSHAGAEDAPGRSVLRLARRIEAVSRVMARPRPHMLRLARLLAIQPESTSLRPHGAIRTWHRRHGGPEYDKSRDMLLRALRASTRAPEPG